MSVIRNEEISGGDGGVVHVNEGFLAKNHFNENSDEFEKGEVESAVGNEQVGLVEVTADGRTGSNATSDTGYMQFSVGKFPKEIAAELQACRGKDGKHNGEGISGNIGELGVGIIACQGRSRQNWATW
ncbi:hypothetical protein FRX31_014632 [Thalictrum thalictroides]|uniref:Uncharacterized protein n=1 Tax=Thalictrum thalictroides TaxID=46969 RepID=A0A7J6WEJ8_THATH|nr:hypothetical protein FRX31_014632 [Thalictrum thalictroides]